VVAAIVSVGSEITRGEVADSNADWLSSRLTALGFAVTERVCVDADRGRLAATLARLGRTSRVIVATGALGPTGDDVTVDAVADAVGVPRAVDPALAEAARWRSGDPVDPRSLELPEGAVWLGRAPLERAFAIRVGEAHALFLPGEPAAMEGVFESSALRHIIGLAQPLDVRARLRTYGLSEAALEARVRDLAGPHVAFGFRATPPEVTLTVRAGGADRAEASERLGRVVEEVRARLGGAVFADDDQAYAACVGRALRSRGLTLAVAESCTGGLIGSMLTAVPGSSEYLLLDAVTYSNASKERVLQVSNELLLGHGAVSRECARAMAAGARRVSGADLAIAVSGVAGPTGGSADKPVGLVYLAMEWEGGFAERTARFEGDRAMVQRQAAYLALSMVREACAGPVPTALASVCG
jgi:nicotinamide-nucleotide amidase